MNSVPLSQYYDCLEKKNRLHDEVERLRAALEGIVKALEDGEEQGFLHMHIVAALDIARRALKEIQK
jgi:hypothetical protein